MEQIITVIISCVITGIFNVLLILIPILSANKKDKEIREEHLNESMKCSLRNDILSIYDSCKAKKVITMYQLQAITYSFEQYKKLGGNSFVDEIMEKVKQYDTKD